MLRSSEGLFFFFFQDQVLRISELNGLFHEWIKGVIDWWVNKCALVRFLYYFDQMTTMLLFLFFIWENKKLFVWLFTGGKEPNQPFQSLHVLMRGSKRCSWMYPALKSMTTFHAINGADRKKWELDMNLMMLLIFIIFFYILRPSRYRIIYKYIYIVSWSNNWMVT